MSIRFNYSNLKMKIKEDFKNQKKFAEALGISEQALNKRLNNKVHFRLSEIRKAKELLKIEDRNAPHYFFVEDSKTFKDYRAMTGLSKEEVAEHLGYSLKMYQLKERDISRFNYKERKTIHNLFKSKIKNIDINQLFPIN